MKIVKLISRVNSSLVQLRWPIMVGLIDSTDWKLGVGIKDGKYFHRLVVPKNASKLFKLDPELLKILIGMTFARCKLGEDLDPCVEDLVFLSPNLEKEKQKFFHISVYWTTFVLVGEQMKKIFGPKIVVQVLNRSFESLWGEYLKGKNQLYLNVRDPVLLGEYCSSKEIQMNLAVILALAQKIGFEDVEEAVISFLANFSEEFQVQVEDLFSILKSVTFALRNVEEAVNKILGDIWKLNFRAKIVWKESLQRYVWEIGEHY